MPGSLFSDRLLARGQVVLEFIREFESSALVRDMAWPPARGSVNIKLSVWLEIFLNNVDGYRCHGCFGRRQDGRWTISG